MYKTNILYYSYFRNNQWDMCGMCLLRPKLYHSFSVDLHSFNGVMCMYRYNLYNNSGLISNILKVSYFNRYKQNNNLFPLISINYLFFVTLQSFGPFFGVYVWQNRFSFREFNFPIPSPSWLRSTVFYLRMHYHR